MLIMLSFKTSLIIEQFQGNYLEILYVFHYHNNYYNSSVKLNVNTTVNSYLSFNRIHIRSSRAFILVGFIFSFLARVIIIIFNLIIFIKSLPRNFYKNFKNCVERRGPKHFEQFPNYTLPQSINSLFFKEN